VRCLVWPCPVPARQESDVDKAAAAGQQTAAPHAQPLPRRYAMRPRRSFQQQHLSPPTTPLGTFFNRYHARKSSTLCDLPAPPSNPLCTRHPHPQHHPRPAEASPHSTTGTNHTLASRLWHPSNLLPKARIAPEPTRPKRDLNTGRQTPHCSSPTSIASPTFPFDSTWRTLALAQKPMVACTSGPRPNRCTCIAQTRPNKRYSH
jgi:hypothetical protein